LSPRRKSSRDTAIEVTQRSLADLREIERYSVKKWGRSTADKYLDEIAAALDRLRDHPEILRLEPDFAPGLYFYRVKKHVLVCDFQAQTVIVLTVIHTSMDVPARLLELEPQLVAEAQFLHDKLRKQSRQD
jgi:toxin ParE1/3/4